MEGTGALRVRRGDQGEAHVPVATRPRRRLVPSLVTTAGLWAVLACAGIVGAAPAAAVDDPARPDSRVTHGPSCRPGGIVVEVTGGSTPYAVTLATTRRPAGEDAAEVAPGAVVVLGTGDVDWGETIDPSLAYTALDGSGTAFVDELDGYSSTRPRWEDCAAIAPPTAATGVPSAAAPPVAAGPAADVPVPDLPAAGGAGAAAALDRTPVVPAAAEEATPDGDTSWPLLAGGSALVAVAVGLAAAAGRRRPRPPAPPGSG
ncbi:hypothetical protein DQ238_12340 [Geodermatophilus sp. TF02-6]|uniref:hypothetical protein n=1 Tax=Geodermatophilus sp. TF02-6 TaxID=2250575 RepID=UPI000DEA5FAC|nr:hypothetical protein [Geodermatophilus sp. TF02-6]RBY78273.1 hypothetical protein DQ238_12340 [Geodermatophilus sp. TF02-6]